MRALILTTLLFTGCNAVSSTEVGVRTTMVGLLEPRGTQQSYPAGGVYFIMPYFNSWATLPTSQQNLLMNTNAKEGDRPIPDDVAFKTKDGNNVYIDVNVMWRVDPTKAGTVISRVGQSIEEIKERVVRPMSRSVIRDTFNEITSEEYYQVTVKNKVAEEARAKLAAEVAPYGVIIDMLQVQQHRFDTAYQAAINAQKQAEADVQKLIEQQKAMEQQKQSELEAKRSEWNKLTEEALGQAGRAQNDADGYYQTKTNEAKALLASAMAEAEATKKEAEALSRLGGDAYVKMQLAKMLGKKRVILVPAASASTLNVNKMVDFFIGKAGDAAP
ncbi:MAG: SPFH domain-containing protein [Myxococcota bacterium]